MNVNPKVSIITVCYNAEAFIERTIKSVIEQTYPSIEYIVIDGASSDNTVDIIKKYEESIDFWISEPDKSHFDAMNKGLDHSQGEYILYLNAGDRLKDAFSLQKLMDSGNRTDLLYSRAVYIDEEGNTRPWHKKTPYPHELTKKSFINGMVICHHCMVVKRSLAPHYKLEPWKVSNDIDWAIRVMEKVKTVHFHDEIFCLYLEGGISNKFRLKAVKERFNISVLHFGLKATIFEQFKIIFQIIKRGSIT